MAPDTAHETASPLATEVIRELFTDDDRATFYELGYRRLIEGAVRTPDLQVRMFLGAAGAAVERYGDEEDGIVRKSLDAAGALVGDVIGRHAGEYMDELHFVKTYIKVADAAHELEQGPDYVRTVLDMATEKVMASPEHPRPQEQADKLVELADTAHRTGQDPEYLKAMVERVRGLHIEANKGLADEATTGSRIRQLRTELEMAGRYGLGSEYSRELIKAASDRWQLKGGEIPVETLTAKVCELSHIAIAALRAGQDEAYVRGIIDSGRQIAVRGADTAAFAHLARTAHVVTDGDARYSGDILLDGYRAIEDREEPKPLRQTLLDYNQLMLSLYGRGQDRLKSLLQGQFAIGGLKQIEAAGGTERQQHMLLNTLLQGDVYLSEEFMRINGLEHKPLSYVFKPGRKPVLGRSQEPAVS